jgi:hypothetical protein
LSVTLLLWLTMFKAKLRSLPLKSLWSDSCQMNILSRAVDPHP